MSIKKNISEIYKNKEEILEGIKNNIFKKKDVEIIAKQRMQICEACSLYTKDGDGCMVPGTTPCCNKNLGGCGCSLNIKVRSLSSECPKGHWFKIEEE